MTKVTQMRIPIILGEGRPHVMGSALISESEEKDEVTLGVSGIFTGSLAKDLAAIMSGSDKAPIAIQLIAIPVAPHTTKSRENI